MACTSDLPVAAVLPELRAALGAAPVVLLVGPPGSGKTTLAPLALLDEPWLAGRGVLVLEPRRIAARAAAERMAAMLGEPVGGRIGCTTRFERRTGPATRVELVTEGILTRRLLRDPDLTGIGLVVFDEIHERSLEGDLGLALCLEIQDTIRPELRLLLMSATPDLGELADRLNEPPVVRAEGRRFPVETRWRPPPQATRPERHLAATVLEALRDGPGDVLAFLPGMAELRAAERALSDLPLPAATQTHLLHGDLPRAAQDAALAPANGGERKIVLASAVAETSLTIEGVGSVVDAGLARRQRYSPRTGMSRLVTVPAGRANAEQRCGRAGRTGPGRCYRLWDEAAQRGRLEHLPPEIEEADLAPLVLDVALWGTREPASLRWPTAPPAAAWARACELLRQLGAIDASGAITAHGRAMARLPLHPRLGHMLTVAVAQGDGGTALAVAALLSARNPWRDEGVDLTPRVVRLRKATDSAGDLLATARQLGRLTSTKLAAAEPERTGAVLALAFPDRIGQQRGAPGTYRLSNGRGAAIDRRDPIAAEPWIVAAELDDAGADARVRLAARLPADEIEALAATQATLDDRIVWDARSRSVVTTRVRRLGELRLDEQPLAEPDPAAVAGALVEGLRRDGLGILAWSPAARQLRLRLDFLHRHEPGLWPPADDAALLAAVGERSLATGIRRAADLDPLDLLQDLLGGARAALDAAAPSHVELPSGSRIAIDYGAEPPVLAVRLQELFGCRETPTVRHGRTRLMLHLLSPARRPVQVTQDLEGFWARAYPEIRKELRGRYPRDAWPDDPLTAAPTARARAR